MGQFYSNLRRASVVLGLCMLCSCGAGPSRFPASIDPPEVVPPAPPPPVVPPPPGPPLIPVVDPPPTRPTTPTIRPVRPPRPTSSLPGIVLTSAPDYASADSATEWPAESAGAGEEAAVCTIRGQSRPDIAPEDCVRINQVLQTAAPGCDAFEPEREMQRDREYTVSYSLGTLANCAAVEALVSADGGNTASVRRAGVQISQFMFARLKGDSAFEVRLMEGESEIRDLDEDPTPIWRWVVIPRKASPKGGSWKLTLTSGVVVRLPNGETKPLGFVSQTRAIRVKVSETDWWAEMWSDLESFFTAPVAGLTALGVLLTALYGVWRKFRRFAIPPDPDATDDADAYTPTVEPEPDLPPMSEEDGQPPP